MKVFTFEGENVSAQTTHTSAPGHTTGSPSMITPTQMSTKPVSEAPLVLEELDQKWVIVKYDNKFYPGRVTSIANNTATVSAMSYAKRKQNKFFWPKIPDILQYNLKDIITVIDQSKNLACGHSEIGLFSAVWCKLVQKMKTRS